MDPKTKKNDCPYYERGFCKNGPQCKNLHRRREICENYVYGFCPKGPNCEKVHLKSIISPEDDNLQVLANFGIIQG